MGKDDKYLNAMRDLYRHARNEKWTCEQVDKLTLHYLDKPELFVIKVKSITGTKL